MEVHAHTHTPRKKWTHYFWEFLMLFLAVFCGFLAENQREHYIEQKREIKYIQSIVKDLEADIDFFTRAIKINSENQQRMDSLINELREIREAGPANQVYYLARSITSKVMRMEYHNSSFEQMKNSGSLRLIRNHAVLNSILQYYQSLEFIDKQLVERSNRLVQLFLGKEELFDAWGLKAVADSGFSMLKNSPKLLTYEKKIINKYVTRLVYYKTYDGFLIYRTNEIYLPTAVRLIELLKKEYHLE